MKVGTRIIFSIFILIILAMCACVILSTLGFVDLAVVQPVLDSIKEPGIKYVWAGVAAVLFVVGVALLFFGPKKDKTPATVTLVSTADGSVNITVQALEELSMRCLNEISGIIVHKITIIPALHAPANIKIKVEMCVKAGVEMPSLTVQITNALKEYIEKYSGITVGAVDIRIQPYKAPQYPAK